MAGFALFAYSRVCWLIIATITSLTFLVSYGTNHTYAKVHGLVYSLGNRLEPRVVLVGNIIDTSNHATVWNKIKIKTKSPFASLPTYSVVPSPLWSKTRTAMAVARLAIPYTSAIAVPVEIYYNMIMMQCVTFVLVLLHVTLKSYYSPATWVPCPFRSVRGDGFCTKSAPYRFKSEWTT